MRFLTKIQNSAILAEGLTYKENDSLNNARLRGMLLSEQRGFCAYTEKRVSGLDSVDVEHFDRTKKGHDDYFNYYATLHKANQQKRAREKRHAGAVFFTSLFFHIRDDLARRIRYVPGDNVYEETDEGDAEAKDFIDYLGFNDSLLFDERSQHIRRLRCLFLDADFDVRQEHAWFAEHPEELSFVTAIESEFGLDLAEVLERLTA